MKSFPIPTRRVFLTLIGGVILFLLGLFREPLFYLGLGVDMALCLLVLADYLRIKTQLKLEVSLTKQGGLVMGHPKELNLSIENKGKVDFTGELRFDLPPFWSQLEKPLLAEMPSQSIVNVNSRLLPLRRGAYTIERVHLKLASSLKLVKLYTTCELNEQLDVFPDFKELKEYIKLSRNNRLLDMGIHKNRYKGLGTELESLREYSRDDDARFIDWKATARMNRPVTKSFQMESTNDIVIALDCGRLMTSEENNLSALDLAVNAMLVLAHVAVSMGDRVRIIPFADTIKGDFTSQRGSNPMKKIIAFLSPLKAEPVESNYAGLFNYLQNNVKKRALVIVASDMVDDLNYDLFQGGFNRLRKRHALLFLLLRDELLQQEADRRATNTEEVFSTTAARTMCLQRYKALTKLKKSGTHVLDLLPSQITAGLIDKYMQLKSTNRI